MAVHALSPRLQTLRAHGRKDDNQIVKFLFPAPFRPTLRVDLLASAKSKATKCSLTDDKTEH
jgi:hypothetical protein